MVFVIVVRVCVAFHVDIQRYVTQAIQVLVACCPVNEQNWCFSNASDLVTDDDVHVRKVHRDAPYS